MSKFTLNKTEYDLSTSENCALAIEAVQVHIEKLNKKKTDVENKLSDSLLDFTGAKKLRRNKLDFEEEIRHFHDLLQNLKDKQGKLEKFETECAIDAEIERLENQSIEISNLCSLEIPRCSRKLALIAAALEHNRKDVERLVDRAAEAGMEAPDCAPDPIQRIAGYDAHASKWLKELSLPMMDEQPDIVKFWPVKSIKTCPDSHQDNAGIEQDVEGFLAAENITETAQALFDTIDNMRFQAREAEHGPFLTEDHSKPRWYERPRSEWPSILNPNSVTAELRRLGNPVAFWLELPEQRKYGAFIHLLSPEQREQAVEKLPKKERKKYLDHLVTYASNDSGDAEEESLKAAACS